MRRTEIHASRALLTALVATFSATPAFAATVVCGGTVAQVSYENAYVLLRLSNMNTPAMICHLDVNFEVAPGYVTSPAACKVMYASFLAAKLSGATLNNVYFDGPAIPASCAAWAPWTYAHVRHYEM